MTRRRTARTTQTRLISEIARLTCQRRRSRRKTRFLTRRLVSLFCSCSLLNLINKMAIYDSLITVSSQLAIDFILLCPKRVRQRTMSTSDHPNDGFVTRPNETMEGDEASTSTAPDAAPVPGAAAPAPTKGGRGGRGGARKASSAAGRGKKRNSELDGLRDSLSAEPSTSKRPRRGAAPAVLETSTSTSTTTATAEVEDDTEQPELGNEAPPTVIATAGPSKKRVIQTSSEDEEGGASEAAGKTGFKIKLKKPSVEEPQALEKASAVADQVAQPAVEHSDSAVQEDALPDVVAPQPLEKDDTQPVKVQQEALVEPPMQEPSPPSTLATPVIEVAEDSDTGSTSAATNNRKKVSNKPGMAGKARGGPTPSISQQTLPPGSSPMPGSSGLSKKPKQPIKPPGSLKPKAKPAAAAAAPAASANIFDSLFSGIVATTDHEKQLKKDRDERAIAVAKQKEREAQAKKATLSLARVAAAGGTDSGNEGSDSQSVSTLR